MQNPVLFRAGSCRRAAHRGAKSNYRLAMSYARLLMRKACSAFVREVHTELDAIVLRLFTWCEIGRAYVFCTQRSCAMVFLFQGVYSCKRSLKNNVIIVLLLFTAFIFGGQ